MLNLKLRDEFRTGRMPRTAISLVGTDDSGAAQRPADEILTITYPTEDVIIGLRNVSATRKNRPIVLIGERGRGKSHIMAVLHHAFASPDAVQSWAKDWSSMASLPLLGELTFSHDYLPISEAVHNHEYNTLWDLLFDRHPDGKEFLGMFKESGQPYPKRSLLEQMFERRPTALILDEFQKWFDGLSDAPGADGTKYRTWAENFIQNLSELAVERPEILVLVVSVLNNDTEAFRQIHRNSPVLIDFSGKQAQQDRQQLALHRLFENRMQIPHAEIENCCTTYADERFRLLFQHQSDAERAARHAEVYASWPFSPELFDLLDNQILMAEAAQEARDLIRILAQIVAVRSEAVPVITPADFHVDGDGAGVQSLVDSIVSDTQQYNLREIAQSNLQALHATGDPLPHAREFVSALWMRSLSPGRHKGGSRLQLQLDLTRDQPIDDNAFVAELTQLIENSINIHGEESAEGRLRFELEENPRSKVRSTAKNDRLWSTASTNVAGQVTYPGSDTTHIRQTLTHLLVPEATEPRSQVIVLGPNWQMKPWDDLLEKDQPANWSRPVLLVIPDPLIGTSASEIPALGSWLKKHVQKRRNTIRFLVPKAGATGLYRDPSLRFMSRCSYLTKIAWNGDSRYSGIRDEFDRPFRGELKDRFDRFAVLHIWDNLAPESCVFEIASPRDEEGKQPRIEQLANAIESQIVRDMFDPADFRTLILDRAKQNYIVGDVMDELSEPPPNRAEAIPYLGTNGIYEKILGLVVSDHIAVNVGNNWYGRLPEHDTDDQAQSYIKAKAWRTGKELREVRLGLPQAKGGGTVSGTQTVTVPPGGITPPGGAGPILPPIAPPPPGGGVGPIPPGGAGPGGGGLPPLLSLPKTQRSIEPANGLNLVNTLEGWGVDNPKELRSANIGFSGLTVQQLKQVLQRLPSALKASLEITYREDDAE